MAASEARIHFELFHRLRTAFPELEIQPEYRIAKAHRKGYVKADLAIPSLRIIIEVKHHANLDRREVLQLREYQALEQTRGWKLLYCKSRQDIDTCVSRVHDLVLSSGL